jgi:tetratricopeptide (TPR) repeat protein
LKPGFAETLNNRGAAYEALDDRERALQDYLDALARRPRFAAPCYNAARLYAKMGDVDRCIQYLGQAIDLEPSMGDDAAQDDELGWVLQLRRLRDDRRDIG